jgi:phosphoesterase RecJ-like protein
MSTVRLERIAEQLKQEISGLVQKGLKDPRIGFVTITGVEVTADLQLAKVFFSTPGTPEQRADSQQGLASAAGFIRNTLKKRLRLKTIPELSFHYDRSLDEGDHMERLLKQVREQEGWDDPTRVRGSAAEVARILRERETFLVTTHTNPDGDAVASLLAMRRLLLALGKKVRAYHPEEAPVNFRFLPDLAEVRRDFGEESYDATIVLDCSELARASPLPPPERQGILISIDHHLSTEPLGQAYLLDPQASSIGELIAQIMAELGVQPDRETAICIYTSILSDTGSFRYSNTTPKALETAARMVAAGVQPWDVARAVYESQPLERLRLLSRVLPTLDVGPGGKYASITILLDMYRESGGGEELIDGFINYPRGIQGVEVAIQFRETAANRFKVSFRSAGKVDVAEIASAFGGGGHRNASGCTLEFPLADVRNQIYQAVEAALSE